MSGVYIHCPECGGEAVRVALTKYVCLDLIGCRWAGDNPRFTSDEAHAGASTTSLAPDASPGNGAP